jgi:hypothetical protein
MYARRGLRFARGLLAAETVAGCFQVNQVRVHGVVDTVIDVVTSVLVGNNNN